MARVGIDSEFVVSSPEVLHERVAVHDHAGRVITLEAAHRTEPRLQAAVISLAPLICVLRGVMKRRDQLLHDGEERPRAVRHHLRPLPMSAEGTAKNRHAACMSRRGKTATMIWPY
jgi:hypothetical protein